MEVRTKSFQLVEPGSEESRFVVDPSGFLFVELARSDREFSAPFSQLDFEQDLAGHTRVRCVTADPKLNWQLTMQDEDAGYLLSLIGNVEEQLESLLQPA
ncbi:hypothetical protein [Ferrimonas pelagia]|uniref:DUF2442 domain-containing protein n=1 Tax=Ferrimonas pelagia TaxID=1177826 RepID=A0ABP9F3M3_9GAMM